MGKVNVEFERGRAPLGILAKFEGYVVSNLSKEVLCGIPFMKENNIIQNIPDRKMTVNGRTIIEDPSVTLSQPFPFDVQHTTIKKVHNHIDDIGRYFED